MNIISQDILLRMVLTGSGLPHQVLAGMWLVAGWDAVRVVAELSDMPLNELHSRFADLFRREGHPDDTAILFCLSHMRRHLDGKLRDLIIGDSFRSSRPGSIDRTVGETTLRDYFTGHPEADIASWLRATEESLRGSNPLTSEQREELRLVAGAVDGNQEAYRELYELHRKPILGFIRSRTLNDADAEDVAQEAWLKIHEKLAEWNPLRGSFRAFANYWAGIKLMHFYDSRKQRRQVEVLFTELIQHHPELDRETEAAAVIERLGARTGWAAGEKAILALLHDALITSALNGASPPHQILAFGFSKLLEWKPQEIVAGLSNDSLRRLTALLIEDCSKVWDLTGDRIAAWFNRISEKVEQRFDHVVDDQKTLESYAQLTDRIIGDTVLLDYYTGRPEDNIVQWRYAVERRVKSELIRSAQCPSLKLLRKKIPDDLLEKPPLDVNKTGEI